MKKLIILLLPLLFLSCVGPKEIIKEVPVYVTKTEYQDKYVRDTIYVEVTTDKYRVNETLYITKDRLVYKERLVRDSIRLTDSIPVVLKETTTVEVNKLKWWQKTLCWTGGVIILLVILYIGFKIAKRFI